MKTRLMRWALPIWKGLVYLNRLREKNYRRQFEEAQEFEIVDWETEFIEGEELVTDELLRELSNYTQEELTKRSIIITLRRKPVLNVVM